MVFILFKFRSLSFLTRSYFRSYLFVSVEYYLSFQVKRMKELSIILRHGITINQRYFKNNRLSKDEDTKLKKKRKRKLLERNIEEISLVVTVFRIP